MNQAEETLPPTHHVLRPHHIFLLAVFLITFKEFESKDLPPLFVLHIYRFLLNEVSEVCMSRIAYRDYRQWPLTGRTAQVVCPIVRGVEGLPED